MRNRRRWIGVALAVTGLLAGGMAGAAWGHDGTRAERTANRTVADGVPAGFEPTTSWWTSNDAGVVGGKAPCDGDQFCHVLLATEDGGQTWTERTAPKADPEADLEDVLVAQSGDRSTTVVITNNWHASSSAYVSYDGQTWQQPTFEGDVSWAGPVSQIGDHVYLATQTDLPHGEYTIAMYRAPVGSDEWTKVDGTVGKLSEYQRLDARGTAGLLTGYHETATTADGQTWNLRDADCGDKGAAVGGDDAMYLFCGKDDGESQVEAMASSDGGATFSKVGAVDFPGKQSKVTDAAAFGDTVTLTGYRGDDIAPEGCLATTSFDGGKTWQQSLDVGQPEQLQPADLRFTDADYGTLVCRNSEMGSSTKGADVYRTTDGGASWEPLGVNGGTGSDWFSPTSTTWRAGDIGYMLGWTPCDAYEYCAVMRRSDDGGQTWTEAPAPSLSEAHGAQDDTELLFTERDGTTVGLAYVRGSGVHVSNDGGRTWEHADIDGGAGAYDAQVAASTSHLYAALSMNLGDGIDETRVFRAPIGTNAWEPVPELRVEGDTYFSIDVRDGTAVAKLGGAVGADVEPVVFTSTDDGETWTERENPCPDSVYSTYVAGGSDLIYAKCDDNADGFLVSENGGETFTKVSDGPDIPLETDTGQATGDTIQLGSGSSDEKRGCEVFSSHDSGASWQQARLEGPSPMTGDPVMRDLVIAEDGSGGALCGNATSGGGTVLSHTTDGGQTWSPVELN